MKGADILAALKDALYIYRCMPPVELNIITGIDPWKVLAIKEAIKAAIDELEQAERSRKAIKEGIIRQSLANPLDKPASDTDREVAEELARQWDEEDVSCPKHKREKEDDES